jgi:hypothetical protein
MTKISIIYLPGGMKNEVKPENGKYFTLKELQTIVGGYIECLSLDNAMTMVVNEEGKLDGLPCNGLATEIAYNSGFFDIIVGSALVCPSKFIK